MATKKSRKNPRAQVSLLARYRSPTAFEFVNEECFDLSAGGMFIKSPAPAPVGTLLKLECAVDGGAETLRGVARVVWLRERESEGQPSGMGVKFVKLEQGTREIIHRILVERGSVVPGELESLRPSAAQIMVGAGAGDAALAAASEPTAVPVSVPPAMMHELATRSSSPSARSEEVHEIVDGITEITGDSEPPARPAPRERDSAGRPPLERKSNGAAAERGGSRPSGSTQSRPTPVSSIGAPPSRKAPLVVLALALVGIAALAVFALRPAAEPAAEPSPPVSVSVPEPQPAAAPTEPAPAVVAQAPTEAAPPEAAPAAAPVAPPTEPPKHDENAEKTSAAEERRAARHAAEEERAAEEARAAARAAQPEPAPVAAVVPAPPEAPSADPAATHVSAAPTEVALPAPAVPTSSAPPASYVLQVVTTPEGALVSAAGTSAPSPCTLELGTLDAPVEVRAELMGYSPAVASVDRIGFMLDDGRMRRRITLSMHALPAPLPATEPAVKASRHRSSRESSREPAATPEGNPSAKPGAVTPMQQAMSCLATGDNACVIKALEGKARSAQELELLIETHRTLGNTSKAEHWMQVYVEKYPNERRANTYRRQLERRQSESAAQ